MLINILSGGLSASECIIYIMSSLVVILFTLPIHEWAHGFVSTKLGDPTPRYQGRLTLNPLAHLDWIGSAMLLLVGIGWAKPVQVNARYYKNPKWGMALVAIAGPISNIVIAFIALFLWNAVGVLFIQLKLIESTLFSVIGLFLFLIAQINVYLAVFNLIPIPPFDGSRILFTFLPQKYYFKIMQYERFIFIGVFALVYSGVLDKPLDIATNNILISLDSLASLPFRLFGV